MKVIYSKKLIAQRRNQLLKKTALDLEEVVQKLEYHIKKSEHLNKNKTI